MSHLIHCLTDFHHRRVVDLNLDPHVVEPYLRGYRNKSGDILDDLGAILGDLRSQYYDPVIVGTEDMEGKSLETKDGQAQAASQLNFNVVEVNSDMIPRKNIIYLPPSIMDAIEEVRTGGSAFFTLLQNRGTDELNTMNWGVQKMHSDSGKNIFMYRRGEGEKSQIIDELGSIEEQLKGEFDIPDNAMFEGVITGKDKVIFGEEGVVVEGYSKAHRVEEGGDFQELIRGGSEEVMKILTASEFGNFPKSFDFRNPDQYYHPHLEKKEA